VGRFGLLAAEVDLGCERADALRAALGDGDVELVDLVVHLDRGRRVEPHQLDLEADVLEVLLHDRRPLLDARERLVEDDPERLALVPRRRVEELLRLRWVVVDVRLIVGRRHPG
jgi:hypothetical protein